MKGVEEAARPIAPDAARRLRRQFGLALAAGEAIVAAVQMRSVVEEKMRSLAEEQMRSLAVEQTHLEQSVSKCPAFKVPRYFLLCSICLVPLPPFWCLYNRAFHSSTSSTFSSLCWYSSTFVGLLGS